MDEIKVCSRCKVEILHKFKPRPDTMHAGELRCSKCGTFWGWRSKLPEERTNGGAQRRNSSTYSPSSLDCRTCQMCLRPRKMLGIKETLLIHHVKEIQDGGDDIPSNIWVLCSSCHGLVHHMRTYLYRHFSDPEVSLFTEEPLDNDQGVPWEN
jgi:5-methylcytosine-specific restriction endonuclease McrA